MNPATSVPQRQFLTGGVVKILALPKSRHLQILGSTNIKNTISTPEPPHLSTPPLRFLQAPFPIPPHLHSPSKCQSSSAAESASSPNPTLNTWEHCTRSTARTTPSHSRACDHMEQKAGKVTRLKRSQAATKRTNTLSSVGVM